MPMISSRLAKIGTGLTCGDKVHPPISLSFCNKFRHRISVRIYATTNHSIRVSACNFIRNTEYLVNKMRSMAKHKNLIKYFLTLLFIIHRPDVSF